MHIAGGIYREICLRPAWNGLFGSGGRAALSVAELGGAPTLHAYVEDGSMMALDRYRDLGVDLRLSLRGAAIAFAYFHPLSRPHMEPSVVDQCDPLRARGETVLRFGYVEGSAVVAARRAVFDPQGWRDPLEFGANGSEADELALVLNEGELRRLSETGSVDAAARELISSGRSSVVVVKRGFRGAVVVNGSLQVHEVPAYRSERVFKIGTGDVFSARFAYHWGEERCTPLEAARLASMAVARYASTRSLSDPPDLTAPTAVGGDPLGTVAVIGAIDTIGSYYTREEAVFRLRELGVEAVACSKVGEEPVSAVLLLADGLDETAREEAMLLAERLPVVVLRERGDRTQPYGHGSDETDDFVTAIYRTAWAACAPRPG